MSRDPIRYEGGDNLYEYVEGRPLAYLDPSGLSPSDIFWTGSDILVSFGDGILLGYGPEIREWMSGEDDVAGFSSGAEAARVVGAIWGSVTCGGLATRALASASNFERLRFLNRNRYLRIGPGRMPRNGHLPPGPHVPRVSIGGAGSGHGRPHIDLRIRPID